MLHDERSRAAVERARLEAVKKGVDVRFYVADMRQLADVEGSNFDAVICMDNALPHLPSDEDLLRAATEIHAKLRGGGTSVLEIVRPTSLRATAAL